MKFLLDESVDIRLKDHLRAHGHDATAIASDYVRGMVDRDVLLTALSEKRVLITNDSDFGS